MVPLSKLDEWSRKIEIILLYTSDLITP